MKRKAGRPKLANPRDRQVNTRVTDKTYQGLVRWAQRLGTPLNTHAAKILADAAEADHAKQA